jgi:uncharacterized protein (TIGR01777 family)
VSAASVTVTGATGLLGSRIVTALCERGTDVTVLTRRPERARKRLGARAEAVAWDPLSEPAPAAALSGRDAVVHLLGETIAQRWSSGAKRAMRDSRLVGTQNLLAGLADAAERPGVLISASAAGYYGARGEEPLDEDASPGADFLAGLCVEWEAAGARAGADLGMRTVQLRTGVVLDSHGGALEKMLPPFRLGVGGPVAGGRQYIPWIHAEDHTAMTLAALDNDDWSGPFNVTAPEPATNAAFSRELGRALHRPAVLPVPALALRLLYGDMAAIVTTGQRAVPAKALVLGYEFRHPQLPGALRAALG